ncbi:MAG: hypothetical protein Q9207_006449 [Kuettlingeria erythrocarpa]
MADLELSKQDSGLSPAMDRSSVYLEPDSAEHQTPIQPANLEDYVAPVPDSALLTVDPTSAERRHAVPEIDSSTSSSSTLSGVPLPEQDTFIFPAPPSGLPPPLQPILSKDPQPGITVRIPPGQLQTNALVRPRTGLENVVSEGPVTRTLDGFTLSSLVDHHYVPSFLAKNPAFRCNRARVRMELIRSLRLGASKLVLQVETWRQHVPHGPDPDLTFERHRGGFDREGRYFFDWGVHRAALIRRRDDFRAVLTDFVNEVDQGLHQGTFIDGYLLITPRMYTNNYPPPRTDDGDGVATECVERLDSIPEI